MDPDTLQPTSKFLIICDSGLGQ